ncbi:MAG: N-6 DNA methylase, partial [Acidimicrobiia bacterium]
MIDFENYISQLQKHLSTGDAREHTYRPAQVNFFDQFGVQTENDPARSAHGAPDYVFRNVKNTEIVLAYGEAKDIDGDLDKVEKTEQLDRYAGYNNFVLTNYIEFRFYRNCEKYETVEIAKRDGLALSSIPENFSKLADELTAFFAKPPEVIKNAKRLSAIMGAKARRIRRGIEYMLAGNAQDNTKATEISKVYGLMRELLVHDLEPEKFADMYAQTLVYGLFVARYNDDSPETFSRKEARDLVPASNPFLREFFDHIAGPRFEKGLSIVVDELCQVFEVSEVTNIIDRYLKLTGEDKDDAKDPIIHFYEDFLSEYDASVRKKMGAYYTPTPVVRYMVRAVDEVLKTHFGLSKGLADSSINSQKVELQGKKKVEQSFHRVQVLDPATGTGTFLNEIIKFVHEGFKGQEGLWPSYAKDSLIPRLHGFELMMGAYTIAHLKLGITLKNLGVEDIGSRVGVYLTNSLEEGVPTQPDLFSFGLADAVTHEAQEAAHIKSERPIMVVIGNPPYSGVSSNSTPFANSLVDKYKVEPGGQHKLQERKHWLNDDYVKFIALSEDLIAKNGDGILAFISNHGYLDNPTFRGMRWHLTQTFDTIDIIDLHGNSRKKETALDGGKDENVFDIMQGVSIIIATKLEDGNKGDCKVRVAYLYGKRKNKFDLLNSNTTEFVDIELDEKMYYFVDKNIEGKEEYDEGFSITSI